MIEQDIPVIAQQTRSKYSAEDAVSAQAVESHFMFLIQLADRKRLIATVTGIAASVGIVVALVLPVCYVATSRIMTPQQTPSTASLMLGQLTNAAGGAALAAMAGNSLGLKNPNDVYIGLLQSRPVADAIINEFGLKTLYRAKDLTAARQKLAANTSVVSEKSGFLAVSVTDGDKRRAASIANAYTEQLRSLTKKLAVTEASQRRLFYEEELTTARNDVLDAELALKKIQQQKGIVEPDAQSKGLITGLTELQARAAAKQVEVRALRSFSTERNPDMQLAQNQLASLQAEIQRLQHSNRSSAQASLGLQDIAGGAIDYLSAAHEMQYRQMLFDLLVRQYDAARLDEAKEAAVIQVVELATPPERRSSPHRASIVLTFTILGFLSACCYLYVCNFVRSTPEISRGLVQFSSALLRK